MNALYRYIGAFFRSCAICHLSAPPIFWLCSSCQKKLKSQILPVEDQIREQNGLSHLRLFDWNKDNDFFIRSFINSLKNKANYFILNKLALELSFSYIYIEEGKKSKVSPFINQHSKPKSSAVLVPAPPRRLNSQKDHAFYLASALCPLLKIPVVSMNLKIPNSDLAQKNKTKSQRKKRKFTIQNSQDFLDKDIIFVDDVLTTGSTAYAVYLALNKPKNFLILTLAWRSFYYS